MHLHMEYMCLGMQVNLHVSKFSASCRSLRASVLLVVFLFFLHLNFKNNKICNALLQNSDLK